MGTCSCGTNRILDWNQTYAKALAVEDKKYNVDVELVRREHKLETIDFNMFVLMIALLDILAVGKQK